MSDFDYDLFVIGAGSGGVRASRIAASHGARVAVAEEYRVGGTCVIRGCVPKKLLVYGAHFAEDIHDARKFGWDVPDCKFDWPVLRDNVLAEVDRLEGLYGQTLDNHKVTVLKTRATVAGPQKVRLADGTEVTAERILIATGGWPHVPEFPGSEHRGAPGHRVDLRPRVPHRRAPHVREEVEERAGGPRGRAPDLGGADAGIGGPVPLARPGAAVRADLEARGGQPDGGRSVRHAGRDPESR